MGIDARSTCAPVHDSHNAPDSRAVQNRDAAITTWKRAEIQKWYATLGFRDKANLDDGHIWPTAVALKELTAAEEATSARS